MLVHFVVNTLNSLGLNLKWIQSAKIIYLFSMVSVLTWLITMLGSKKFGSAAASPLMIGTAIAVIILGILLGEYADDIFTDQRAISITKFLGEALINGMLWTTFYIYIRKGLKAAESPSVMLDGFYGGFALTSMVFWGKLTQFALEGKLKGLARPPA